MSSSSRESCRQTKPVDLRCESTSLRHRTQNSNCKLPTTTMLRLTLLLVCFAVSAEAYVSKCCTKGTDCCEAGDVKTDERRGTCAAWLSRSVCRSPAQPTAAPGRECKISLPKGCQLDPGCLGTSCSIQAPPLPKLTAGFTLKPCGAQGPTVQIFLKADGVDFSHTFDASADIGTPLSVNIVVVKAGVFIHVVIGDLENNELPLTIKLIAKWDVVPFGSERQDLATIFDGKFPIDTPCTA